MKGFNEMLKHFKSDLETLHNQLKEKTVEVSIDELVSVTANGLQEIHDVKIHSKAFSENLREDLEKAIVKACNEVMAEARKMVKDKLGKLTEEIDLKNLEGLF